MKITSIKAFAIGNPIRGGTYGEKRDSVTERRPPWTRDAEVANPMSKYPRYKRMRSSWTGNFPSVGCLVTADDGSWGFGTTGQGQMSISLINDHLGPLLAGENPMATEKLYDMMLRIASPYSPSGLVSYAISAIDLALWDLKGRVLNTPVYELAGGPARDRQFCYATGNDTDWHMELGFKATKLACPYGTHDGLDALDKNEAFVAEKRGLIGDHVELMLDCWMAFDVEFAVRLAERLPWMTLTTGEHWYTPYTFFEAARERVVDIFQPDIHWVGGFTACQRIAAIADAAGLEIICHAGMNTPYGQHFT
jgi:L-rhamnonate dehydratase